MNASPLVCAAVLCLLPACRGQAPASREAPDELIVPVAARPASTGDVRAVLHATGLLVPAPGAEFLAVAPEPARVLEVTRKPGDPVASGDLLLRLELPGAAIELARHRADVAAARAAVENARIAQARAREFAERGLIARRDAEDADRAFADAQAALARAESAQAAAETAAGRAAIRAPFAGIVVARFHDAGDLVRGAGTDPILRVVDPRRLEVAASVAAADLPRVLPGASARLVGGADGEPLPLTVLSRASPDAASGSGIVRLALNQPTTMMVDAPVQVDIDLGERANRVVVPPGAIVREGDTTVLFVAAGDRAQRRVVAVGVATDDGVEITDGVKAGELVITRGHNGLADGARISLAVETPPIR